MTNSDYFNFIPCYDDGKERQTAPTNLTENSYEKTKECSENIDSDYTDCEEEPQSDLLSKALQSLCLMQIRKDMNPKY